MVEKFLEDRFEEASVLTLWLHLRPATAYEPRATEKACVWSWRELKSLGNTIGDEISGAGTKRKVLVLANHGFGGRLVTTETLNAALQVLNPDETAAPHGHATAAI
jgi:gentisate 1,2-dioxygenase